MKKPILLLTAWAAILAGCSEHDQPVEQEVQTRAITLSLPTNGTMFGGDDLHIYLFDPIGTRLLSGTKAYVTDTNALGNCNEIELTLPVESAIIQEERLVGRLVVLSNCPTVSDTPDVNELASLTFGMQSEKIPFYGAVNLSETLTKSHEVKCPAIEMLRSAAFVTVQLAEDLLKEGVRLTDGVINKEINTSGYCLPSNALITTHSDYQDTEVYRPYYSQRAANVPLQVCEEGKRLELMMPETGNDGTLAIQINYAVNGTPISNPVANTIYFMDYSTSTAFNIVRNHHYIFTIVSLSADTGIKVEVKDWNEKQADTIVFK